MNEAWYVIRTGVRCEDKAAKALRAEGYRAYVPKMRKSVKHHRTKKWETKHFSLLTRYIFISGRAGAPQWYVVAACDGVESVLGVNGTPTPVPRTVVADFMRVQRSGEFDIIHQERISNRQKRALARSRFRRGTLIQASAGPFSGFAGHVTDVTGKGAIRAMMEIFGRMTPVEFEPGDVKALDGESAAA